MHSRFSSWVSLAFASLVLFLGGSLGTAASAQSLTASLTTDRGCGASAVYNLGEPNTFLFSVSQSASVTLRLQRPDGSISILLANRLLLGGVTYSIAGVIGNPPGQRLLTLDAVAGALTAHAECTYTARAVTQALVVTLMTNRGCGGTALFNIGEPITFSFRASVNAQVTLRLIRPDGTVSTFLANQPVPGGVTQTINGLIGNPPGQRRLILDAVAGSQTAHEECDYTAQAVAVTPLTVTLTTNRGCGAGALFTLGEPITFSYSASKAATVTLRLLRPDGSSSTLVAAQPVQGGVTQTLQGIIGNPLGQRRLLLDAVAGAESAHAECDYTAQSAGGPPTLSLSVDQGCGGTYHVGQAITVTYSASTNTSLSLLDRLPDGTVSPLFTNQPVLAGQSYQVTSVISGQLGMRTLILTTSAGMVQLQTTCLINVVP